MIAEQGSSYRILDSPSVEVIVEPRAGKKLVRVETHDPSVYVSRRQILTSYSDDLVSLILKIKGPGYLCDEIARDEDPSYVRASLSADLFGFFRPGRFVGKRILDFGSGSGASTVALRDLFPGADIAGVELDRDLREIARARARYYRFSPDCFWMAPDGEHLPDGIGTFDLVVLSAVWEHLLPNERPKILQQIWSLLRPEGYIFINQTPYRWSPIEGHTTGLPLLNYLPDGLAFQAARRFCKRLPVKPKVTWQDLLRRGVRGGTPSEIVKIIRSFGGQVRVVSPSGPGITDSIDLWYRRSGAGRLGRLKRCVWMGLKLVKAVCGMQVVPSLTMAVQKIT
jgi:SAM-dependent methyltransferase